MEAFIAQAKSLASTADEAGRKKILDVLRDVQYSLETPYNTLQRLSCVVRMCYVSALDWQACSSAWVQVSSSNVGPYRTFNSLVLASVSTSASSMLLPAARVR